MNKKVVALLSAVLITVLTLIPAMTAMAALPPAYVKTANYGALNMREVTTVDSYKVGSIPYGKKVNVLEYLDNHTWAYVDYEGQLGYVMSRYLSRTQPAPKSSGQAPQPASEPSDLTHIFKGFNTVDYYAVVCPSTPGSFVHMRWAPSKQMDIMTDYYNGHQLEVIAQNNQWCQVRDPASGQTGFMMRSFLRQID